MDRLRAKELATRPQVEENARVAIRGPFVKMAGRDRQTGLVGGEAGGTFAPPGNDSPCRTPTEARLMNIAARWSAWAPQLRSLLRIVAAFMFILAGTSKLFAFPVGMPPDGATAPMMSQIWIGGFLEVVGGGLLLLGLFTRPVAFVLAGEMAVAYFQFHGPQSFWPTVNGGVPAVLYCFVWLYFSAAGPRPWSIDAMRRRSPAL